jgi:hypothetical protein
MSKAALTFVPFRLLEKIEVTPFDAPTLEFCCEKWIDENAPILQLFALKFENKFLRDDAHGPAAARPSAHALAQLSAAPSKPLPALPVPHSTPAPGPLPSYAPTPITDGKEHLTVPTTKAECHTVFESGDVDALANMFGHAHIDLLVSAFTIAQEKEVVARLGIPVTQRRHLEAEFVAEIQAYVRSHFNSSTFSTPSHVPSTSSSSSASSPAAAAAAPAVPLASSSMPAHPAVCLQGHGPGRKDKVFATALVA